MDVCKLGITVGTSGVLDATDALNNLAAAAERANKAIQDLSGKEHGGISIKVAGAVAVVDIAPVTADSAAINEQISKAIRASFQGNSQSRAR